MFLTLTLYALPSWKSDVALWHNAARVTPNNWRVWYNPRREAEKIERGPDYVNDPSVLLSIKNDLITSLKCSVPSIYGDTIFL